MTPTSPYSTRFKIVASAVVAVAVALLVVAVRSFDDGNDDPVLRSGDQDVVEALIPRRDAQVPRQSRVGIDLAIGWEGTLVIDGVEIPADQLDVTPELGLIEYTPGDGKAVEELQPGQNCSDCRSMRSHRA